MTVTAAMSIAANTVAQATDMVGQADRLPYWDSLSDDEKEFVAQNTVIRSYAKGEFLKGPNVSCLGMICILSGSVRALMISEEGREITLFRIGQGDCCIFSASCVLSQITFETEMIATEETKILIVNSNAYAKLMERNVKVKCFSYELAMERSSSVIWVLQEILFAKFDQRLARFLLNECEKSGGNEITMTRETIAREVNTAREVVSRMLKRFAGDGLIRMNRKTISVLDMEGLRSIV